VEVSPKSVKALEKQADNTIENVNSSKLVEEEKEEKLVQMVEKPEKKLEILEKPAEIDRKPEVPQVPKKIKQVYQNKSDCIEDEGKGYAHIDWVTFPPSSNININMMPFIIGDISSIPEEYRQYWPMIELCHGLQKEAGKVGFLTIHESDTRKGESQRRGGVHVDSPGLMREGASYYTEREIECEWGSGAIYTVLDEVFGGIYMASNVRDSTRVWNVRVKPHAIGHMGDVEHLRDLLCKQNTLHSGQLVWLTDKTPHESLPMKQDCHRQYFRVVSSSVSVWYSKHSTPNRLGITPNAATTKIVAHDKFDVTDVSK